MTVSEPSRLAVALLNRFLHENEPLAGDLLEEFSSRQSSLWFWRQVLLAIVIQSFQQRDEEHPLGLVSHPPYIAVGRARKVEPRRINLTASPIPGVGGLGLVAFGVLVALVGPEVLWVFLPAMPGGVVFGLTMAIIRRRAVLSRPAAGSRTLLRDALL